MISLEKINEKPATLTQKAGYQRLTIGPEQMYKII